MEMIEIRKHRSLAHPAEEVSIFVKQNFSVKGILSTHQDKLHRPDENDVLSAWCFSRKKISKITKMEVGIKVVNPEQQITAFKKES
jgi:hypothetical protein